MNENEFPKNWGMSLITGGCDKSKIKPLKMRFCANEDPPIYEIILQETDSGGCYEYIILGPTSSEWIRPKRKRKKTAKRKRKKK